MIRKAISIRQLRLCGCAWALVAALLLCSPLLAPAQDDLTASPASLDFGAVLVGETSAAQTVTLTANTDMALTDMTADLPFTFVGPALPLRLFAGQSTTVDVTFAPGAEGALSGNLTVTYRLRGISTTGTAIVTLSGTGDTGGPPPSPPAAPTSLAAAAAGSAQIDLSWMDNSDNEDGFRVYRSIDNIIFSQIAELGAGAVAHSDSGLTASTTYYYYVTAFNTGGESAGSNTANDTTAAPPLPPAAPGGLSAGAASSTQIDLAWTDNADNEDGFRLYRSTDNISFSQVAELGVNVAAFSNSGLSASATYYYYVTAFNDSGESAASNTASATTQEPPPDGIQLTFQLTTAPEAALGAPIGYRIIRTNTGTTAKRVSSHLDLIAPDATVFTVWSQALQNFLPGQFRKQQASILSSDFTSQTGTFELHGYLKDETDAILAQRSYFLEILPEPANGVYASIGGNGPESHLLGYKYDYSTVVANLSDTSMDLKTITTLVLPDGSEKTLASTALTTLAAGANTITGSSTTTTHHVTDPGTFALRVDVLDSSDSDLATQTRSFVRDPLPADYYPPTFTASAVAAGIAVAHNMDDSACMTTVVGQGAAVGDYDGDGWQDLFFTDQIARGHLWRNNGDGTFTDRAEEAGVPIVFRGAGANFADIDNDGDADLLILVEFGQNVLLRNNGDGTFTDITATAGLATAADQMNVSATFGDYDGDSFLDLYITNHLECTGVSSGDRLYHNEGGSGTFADVTHLLDNSTGQLDGHGLATTFFDYNQDGRIDLYIGNDMGPDFGPNVLWRNDGSDGMGGWLFSDVSLQTNAGVRMSAMGIGVGDYNRDGRYDLIVTDTRDNELLRHDASETFTRAQAEANAERTYLPAEGGGLLISVTWGTAFVDLNNDGWEDIYMAAGTIGPIRPVMNALLLNNRDGSFLDLSTLSGADHPGRQRTAVFADFNQDGFMDTFVAGPGEVPELYFNDGAASGNPYQWLRVKLVGTASNRDAVGARLVAEVGGVELHRQVINGGTFQSNSELIVHFGLGTATQVDSLTVYWPSGAVQTLTNVAAGQTLVITEP